MEGLDFFGTEDPPDALAGEAVSERSLRNEALRSGSSRVFKYGRDGKVVLASGGSCAAAGDTDAWLNFVVAAILLFIMLSLARLLQAKTS